MKKKNQKSKPFILFVAGGSAGHILPALSLGEYIETHHLAKVEFVHGDRALEKQLYLGTPFLCHLLKVGRIRKNVPFLERLKTIFLMLYTLFKSATLIRRLKPDIVFGTGGSVSGPVLLMAWVLRKKTLIWEPNAVPGFANAFLSKFVDHVVYVLPIVTKHFSCHPKKLIQFPYPLKRDANYVSSHASKGQGFGIFILGGGSGSSFLNRVVCDFIERHKKDYFFFHQSGEKDFPLLKKKYKSFKHVELFSFKKNLSKYFQTAQLVICRAGMGALASLSYFGKPSILVPLQKGSADPHQFLNAKWMFEMRASLLMEEKDFTLKNLSQSIENLRAKEGTLSVMARKAKKLNISSEADGFSRFLVSLV